MIDADPLNRRQFLKKSASLGALALSVDLIPALHSVTAAELPAELLPSVFVTLDEEGNVTINCHRAEMGQQVRTSIAQIIADELEADWSRVQIARTVANPEYGDQNTDGSKSIRQNFTRLRQAGAAANYLLRQAAAKQWKVTPEQCHCSNGEVIHASSKRRAQFSSLVKEAAQLPLPELDRLVLKKRQEWRFIGKSIDGVDMQDIVQGSAEYGIDVQLPGMLVAVIQRPPVLHGRIKSLDDAASRNVEGVVDVVKLESSSAPPLFKPLGGVAVLASNSWAALKGRDALKIQWEHGDNATYNSGQFRDSMLDTVRKPGELVREHGDTISALKTAARRISAEYTVPHLSQAPMEPPMATAWVKANEVEVWASVQTPQRTQKEVAKALGLKDENVKVYVTFLGGGFGRKSKPDFAVEAALLSRQAGVPVKVMWSREDDIKHGYFHTVSAQRVEGAIDEQGKTIAWLQRTVFPSIGSTFNPAIEVGMPQEMRMGFADNPFDIANMRLEKGPAKAHVRIGWLRSVANVYHAFATQSFAHELAVAAGRDPRDYLLELIGKPRIVDLAAEGVEYDNYGESIDTYPIDTKRLANVIQIASKRANWDSRKKQGRHLGIAVHRSFLSYVATVVEVKVDENGGWSIPSVYMAIDAGTVVNPANVRAQCEGGCVYGLSCGLGQITASDGVIDQNNFNDYLVARMNQAPAKIDVHVVESDAPPAGVGEPNTPPFLPALCNAIYEASGIRIRDLPLPGKLKT